MRYQQTVKTSQKEIDKLPPRPIGGVQPEPGTVLIKREDKGLAWVPKGEREKKEKGGWKYLRDYDPRRDGISYEDAVPDGVEPPEAETDAVTKRKGKLAEAPKSKGLRRK